MNIRPLSAATWQFREAPRGPWLAATVPGCVHTDLLAAGRIPDPFYRSNENELQWIGEREWEYRVRFRVLSKELEAEVIELVADGLDTVATVRLNGTTVGSSDNMFVGHRWNTLPHLRAGWNVLTFHFASATNYIRTHRRDFTPPREFCDPVGNSVRIRKQPSQFGWDWGPRLVTAGIWRDVRLESWTADRLAHAQVRQRHDRNGRVQLIIRAEYARGTAGNVTRATVALNGHPVAEGTSAGVELTLEIVDAQLWWPAGQGAQPLYDLVVTGVSDQGIPLGSIARRIGLRSIMLDRRPDEWGERFQFVVNGRPIFAKGANWVPAHSFVAQLTRADYERDLTAAVAAHMNCIRLWGGGVYESKEFYELCDELGLLVWHDFMFACALYPADDSFLASVRGEAIYQVRRIHHHACLALWCGNNELAQLNAAELNTDEKLRAGYEKIFHQLLPEVISLHDGTTAYWPSSEWRGSYQSGSAAGEKSGDSHYWDVWHARHPVKDYEKWAFRFCSEFGMQSYSSPQTNATFTTPEDANVFGPAMENHQKNRSGNQVILDYVSRRYRFPKSQNDLIYLSQLNQAYCMQVGVEHYRRLMPRCMGALYWQLNDCWPVTSWSSIEFTGRWKALHYAARRFYAPALVSVHVPGDETTGIGNRRVNSLREVHLYTVFDAPKTQRGKLSWDLLCFDGREVLSGKKVVQLRPRRSVNERTLNLAKPLSIHGPDQLYLRVRLEIDGGTVSEQTVFFAPLKFIALPGAQLKIGCVVASPTTATLTFRANAFQHAFAFHFQERMFQASDNYFDLYPAEIKTVEVRFDQPITKHQILRTLTYQSLVDSYA